MICLFIIKGFFKSSNRDPGVRAQLTKTNNALQLKIALGCELFLHQSAADHEKHRLPPQHQLFGHRARGVCFAAAGMPNTRKFSRGPRRHRRRGATDAGALLDLGFKNVAGRPSCTGGIRHTVELVKVRKPRHLVVIADGDRPGRSGASVELPKTLVKRREFLLIRHGLPVAARCSKPTRWPARVYIGV